MSKTIVMIGGQNINTLDDIILKETESFIQVTDADTGNIIVINVKQIAYVVNRA